MPLTTLTDRELAQAIYRKSCGLDPWGETATAGAGPLDNSATALLGRLLGDLRNRVNLNVRAIEQSFRKHPEVRLLAMAELETEMSNVSTRSPSSKSGAARLAEIVRSDRAASHLGITQIVCIASSKGGAGKTTVAQCLAVEALRQGLPAAIVDTDPQHSAAQWGAQRAAANIDAPTVIALGSQPLKSVIRDLTDRGAKYILIDTPPHSLPAINAALEMATGTVMVTRPNPMDLAALETTWGIVSKINLPASVVLTQVPPGDRARALKLAQGRLDDLGMTHCPTPLTYTLGFPYAQAEALAVQEREPTSKARAEVAEIWSWCRRTGIF